jgi:FkbM family methyltransferase
MIIFDIGACVGEFIDQYINKEGVEIYAFEPLESNYEFLLEKYKNDNRIKIYPYAISNFSGNANFYIKKKEFVGNEGCTLKKDKTNVNSKMFNVVKVIKISDFIKDEKIDKVHIIKIDSEGSEYDIIEDLLNLNLLQNNIEKVFFEDHLRKVPSIREQRKSTIQRILELKYEDKFFVQGQHATYEIPFNTFTKM